MKKFLEEFKEFALRGNAMDMAVGVIIGAAFSDIVTSLTDNFINPILYLFTHLSKFNFNLDTILTYASNFLSSVVNFIIMAFILFCLMKAINSAASFGKKQEAPQKTTKTCPFCQSEIAIKASRCPHCTSVIEEEFEA
jgi:large conductance mechanosensitive channel